jgi:hypothetical protein
MKMQGPDRAVGFMLDLLDPLTLKIGDENVKELSLYSYGIIYAIRSENVFVLAVVHKRRDLTAKDIEK